MALVIEVGDTSYSSGDGNDADPKAVTIPAYADGDLIVVPFHSICGESETYSLTIPSGPNGETITTEVERSDDVAGRAIQFLGWFIGNGSSAGGTIDFQDSGGFRLIGYNATPILVPAGEFDDADPIGAISAEYFDSSSSIIQIPGFTAGATDGGGKLLAFGGADQDPIDGAQIPSGWTSFQNNDPGRSPAILAGRNSAVTDSEPISQTDFPLVGGDAVGGFMFIIREGAGASITITDAGGDEQFNDGETVTITGTGFGATKGNGRVVISPTDDISDGSAVEMTTTAWSDTSIDFTAVRGSFAWNTNLYLFVEEDGGTSNASGTVVQFVPTVVIREIFEDPATGSPQANLTGLRVWTYNSLSDLLAGTNNELTNQSLDGSGQAAWTVDGTGLDPNAPDDLFLIAFKEDGTAVATARWITPSYE